MSEMWIKPCADKVDFGSSKVPRVSGPQGY